MAEGSVSLDVGDEINNAQEELVFQDFHHTDTKVASESEQTITFTDFPQTAEDSDHDDKTELLATKKQASMLSFQYYQAFFEVDTSQVLSRMLFSIYPHPRKHYLHTHLKDHADLYGPFWVCTTLMLSITISGNLANYFTAHQQNIHFQWQYNFHKLTTATLAIFIYWLLMPCLIHLVLRWRAMQTDCSFSELVCLYGYSLCIYIPVSILWLLPVWWLRWVLVLCALNLSGLVLVFNLWHVFQNQQRIGIPLTAGVYLMHALLAVSFMLYFFSAVPPISAPTIPPSTTTLANPLAPSMLLSKLIKS